MDLFTVGKFSQPLICYGLPLAATAEPPSLRRARGVASTIHQYGPASTTLFRR